MRRVVLCKSTSTLWVWRDQYQIPGTFVIRFTARLHIFTQLAILSLCRTFTSAFTEPLFCPKQSQYVLVWSFHYTTTVLKLFAPQSWRPQTKQRFTMRGDEQGAPVPKHWRT